MRKALIFTLLAAVFFNGCALLNFRYKEDSKYLADTMKGGSALMLATAETGQPVDIRDFAATPYRYYVVEGKQRAQVNIYEYEAFQRFIRNYGQEDESSPLEFPVSLALYPDNNILYLLDSVGKKILIYSSDGRFLREFYDFSDEDEEYPYYPVLLRKNSMSGFLMIVDTYNSRILEINESGNVIMQIRDGGSESGKLNFPQSVATDDYGNYYVADGKVIKVFSSRGDHQYNIKNSKFGNITDLCIWRARYLVTTDSVNNKVHFLSLQGNYIYGTSMATSTRSFSRPYRVFTDSSEMLYIVDNLDGEVYVY